MPDKVSISADVSGGTIGVAGAKFVRIENLFVGAAVPPAAELPTRTDTPIAPSPYKGLAYFGPQDAGRFFGREKAIQALVAAVAKRSFTAVVGASGSGKSSVVLAGLAPRLENQGGWRSTYFRIGTEPDKNPFAALARALSPMLGDGDVVDKMMRAQKLANSLANGDISLVYVVGQCRAANPGKRILLIADQFEEIFTLVPDEALRNRFIDALIAAFPDPAQGATPDVSLVLTLRADFVSQAINYRPLADKLKDRVEYLGPMTREELRAAIVEPAKAVGVEFEPGLVDTILDDVEKRPGSLPLLQFALREMWGTPLMTRADYTAIGGVEGALANRAQAIFEATTNRGKNEVAVALFRRLFTRLVTLGEGAEDTRRIVGREELGPDAWALAQKLASEDNRLIFTAAPTPGQETAEVVHEALIRNWPALVEWVSIDREFQTWLRALKPRLDEWHANPSDEGTLLRGGQLAAAEKWTAQRGEEINEWEKAFVRASAELQKAEQRRDKGNMERKIAQINVEMSEALYSLRSRLINIVLLTFMTTIFIHWSLSRFIHHDVMFPKQFDINTVFNYLMSISAAATVPTITVVYANYRIAKIHFVDQHLEFKSRISFSIQCAIYSSAFYIIVTSLAASAIGKTLPWLQPFIYAICVAYLTDEHAWIGRSSRLPNLLKDGAILATGLGLALVAQNLADVTTLDRHLYLHAPTMMLDIFTGFLIGFYVPTRVAAHLVKARYILDQRTSEINSMLKVLQNRRGARPPELEG
jgi:hypothetical protein